MYNGEGHVKCMWSRVDRIRLYERNRDENSKGDEMMMMMMMMCAYDGFLAGHLRGRKVNKWERTEIIKMGAVDTTSDDKTRK